MEVQLGRGITAEKVAFLMSEDTFNASSDLVGFSGSDGELEAAFSCKVDEGDHSSYFMLGQLYFEKERYEKAMIYFERSKNYDLQSRYQLGIIYYDGLGCRPKPIKGVQHLLAIAMSTDPSASHVIHAAQYNVGRACYQGFGVKKQSDSDAERWWLLAANDGDPRASVKAQSTLGMFYSTPGHLDLKKSFFWHSEACGNGSLESQGALGVMFEFGIGVKRCMESAYVCLKEASERGNVYAMGILVLHYYELKFYTKAADLACSLSRLEVKDAVDIARETDCQLCYVIKAISLACFIYARCLSEGHGVEKNLPRCKALYSKSVQMDDSMAAHLQHLVTRGRI